MMENPNYKNENIERKYFKNMRNTVTNFCKGKKSFRVRKRFYGIEGQRTVTEKKKRDER